MHQYFVERLPLFYVFLSGIGFSFQTLIIKLLAEQNFHATFQCVFFRGSIQFILASAYVYFDKDRLAGKGPNLFGDSAWVKSMLFMRSFIGFGGIAFSFLSVELISIGDTTVLTMLSPMLAAILGYIMLGEPWRLPEFCATVVSLIGAVMVAKPPIIFGGSDADGTKVFTGVTYALIAAVSAAFAYVFVRILGTTAKMPWANVCFSQAIGQMVLSIPCLYIFGQKLTFNFTAYQLSMLVVGGTIGAVSQILMTIGMQREKSAAATAMRMSDAAFGFLWQVLFTPDKLSLLSLGGAILVTSSVFIIVVNKQSSLPDSVSPAATDKKAVEMRQLQLVAAIHSIKDSLSLQESYDLEPGFEHEDHDGDEGDDGFDSLFSSPAAAGSSIGGCGGAEGESGYEFINGSSSGGGGAFPAAAGGAGGVAGLDSVERSFLARMIQSPLYSTSSVTALGSANHLYSTLSQGLDDSVHFGEETDL